MPKQKEPTYVTEDKPFPKKFRQLIEQTRSTQADIATTAGVTRQAISLYASGQSTPDIETLSKIRKYFKDRHDLDISYDYLLGEPVCSVPELDEMRKKLGLAEGASVRLIDGVKSLEEPELLDSPSNRNIIETVNIILMDIDEQTGTGILDSISNYLYMIPERSLSYILNSNDINDDVKAAFTAYWEKSSLDAIINDLIRLRAKVLKSYAEYDMSVTERENNPNGEHQED